MEFIDIKKSYLNYKDNINKRLQNVLDNGNFIMGNEVFELEEILANYVGVKHCITVANGTTSLEIALRALNIGKNDEVITVPFSWISSVEVILAVGAKPVFVDINPEFYTLDVNQLESVITENTKAIIAVSLFGQMPDLEKINKIADKYNIAVIEDAAQSFGATRDNSKSCGSSLIGSTSFFPTKPLGCFGDGGALFTNDDRLAIAMKSIRTHGGIVRHHHTHIGLNGRFDTIQAAIILGKWDGFENELKLRSQIADKYNFEFMNILKIPALDKGNSHVYAQYTIRIDYTKRDILIEKLKQKGIPTAVYYPKCFHEQPICDFLNYKYGAFPESEKASKEVLSIPMHPFLSDTEQDFIIKNLISNIKNFL